MSNKLEESKEKQRQIVTAEEGKAIYVLGKLDITKQKVIELRVRELLKGQRDRRRILIFPGSNISKVQIQNCFTDLHIQGREDYGQRVQIKNLYEYCYDILASHGLHIGMRKMPIIMNKIDKFMLLEEAFYREPSCNAKFMPVTNATNEQEKYFNNVLSYFSKQKLSFMGTDKLNHNLHQTYQSIKWENNAADEEDILTYAYSLFVKMPKVASLACRLYRGIFIYEGQHLNKLEYEILKILLRVNESGNIMMTSRIPLSSLKFVDDCFVKDFEPDVYEI